MGTIQNGKKWLGAKINGNTINGISKNGSVVFRKEVVSLIDVDAQNFITNANITNDTQKIAIDYLVSELKNKDLWDKLYAVYPFVGGTEQAHKLNLKNPINSDAAHRLIFASSTHNANGVTGGYINTNAKVLNTSNYSYSLYSRIPFGAGNEEITDSGNATRVYLNYYGSWYSSFARASFIYTNTVISDTIGLYLETAPSASNVKLYKKGVLLFNNTTAFDISPSSTNININLQAGINMAFFHLGENFDNAETIQFNNIVQEFQTILGRQV